MAAKRSLLNKWYEPLLLMLMYKSARKTRDEQREINEILKAILDTPQSSALVQRNLLFVISCIVNGELMISDKALRERMRSSTEYLVQQQSAQITSEQRNLIATFFNEIDKQTLDDEIPTEPLKRA